MGHPEKGKISNPKELCSWELNPRLVRSCEVNTRLVRSWDALRCTMPHPECLQAHSAKQPQSGVGLGAPGKACRRETLPEMKHREVNGASRVTLASPELGRMESDG